MYTISLSKKAKKQVNNFAPNVRSEFNALSEELSDEGVRLAKGSRNSKKVRGKMAKVYKGLYESRFFAQRYRAFYWENGTSEIEVIEVMVKNDAIKWLNGK